MYIGVLGCCNNSSAFRHTLHRALEARPMKVLTQRSDCLLDRYDEGDIDNLDTVVDGGLSLPEERTS